MATRDHLIDWLRDAYAMEEQSVQFLQRQSERTGDYPEFRAKIVEHLEQSRRQAERVRDCLKALGTDTSSLKTGLAALAGNFQALMNVPASDEIVKGAMMGYMHEHFEIAAYRILITAAEMLNEAQIRSTCEAILREEQEMQAWLADHLPSVTRQYLQREAGAVAADRAAAGDKPQGG
jgi:ferritin-like metal-binding protein YciE